MPNAPVANMVCITLSVLHANKPLNSGITGNIRVGFITRGREMKKHTKYPELDRWFNEGLFVRRQFSGHSFPVSQQLWYVNRLRDVYLTHDGVGCIWDFGKAGGGNNAPYIERMGWLHAKVVDGFKHVPNPEIRDIMRAMILCEQKPLPNAHEIARIYGFAWEQFKYDFAHGLYEMNKAKVGMRV